MIRIFIVELQKKTRPAWKSYLEQKTDFEIVGNADSPRVALENIERLNPDVVLIDSESLGMEGLTLCKLISARFAKTKVLMLCRDDGGKHLTKATPRAGIGYLHKNASPDEFVNAIRSLHKGDFQQELDLIYEPDLESFSFANQPEQKLAWRGYLGMGALLNMAVWSLVGLYLKTTPPAYTSRWGIKIMETGHKVELSIPELGKTSSDPINGRVARDPRTDYIYIATNPAVLEKAAHQVGMSVTDFGKPEITRDKDSGIIDFAIAGISPKEARQKARALDRAINQKIEQLQKTELERQERQTREILEAARQKLDVAQKKLSSYQASSPLNSEKQIENLASSIEQLRRQEAELLAQEPGLNNRFQQLSQDLRISSKEANDAYTLLADNVYVKHLEEYARAKTTIANLLSRFTSQHPQMLDIRAELQQIEVALQERASFLLGRSVTPEEQKRITYLALDPKTKIVQKELFQNLTLDRADRQRLAVHNRELKQQIQRLESHLKRVSQEKFTLDSLQHNLRVAETIFASTLAKLDLSKDNIYSIYPPIQLVIEPSLPDIQQPTTPNPRLAFLGGLAGSFLVTTGLILLWSERREQSLVNRQKPREEFFFSA